MNPPPSSDNDVDIVIAVSRQRACQRGILLLIPGIALLAWGIWRISQLDFRPSGVSNRFPEYAWAFLFLLVVFIGAATTWRGGYWLIVALWPGPVEIRITSEYVTFDLGPMGRKSFDCKRIRASYPIDEPDDSDDVSYEALRDPEGYAALHVPKLTHPASKDRLDQLLRHLAGEDEPRIAAQLRPFVENCRRDKKHSATAITSREEADAPDEIKDGNAE